MREHYRQFVKFAIVGGSGVVVNLPLQSDPAGMERHPRSPAPRADTWQRFGFVISVMTNYYLNRRWTFRSSGRLPLSFPDSSP